MYYMPWGLSYFYENSQLDIRQCNKTYAMRASDGSPGDSVISVCFGNLKIRQCNVIYSKRASHGMFLINTL